MNYHEALRCWTEKHINHASPSQRVNQLKAAALLASIEDQTCPKVGYRAFGVDIAKVVEQGSFYTTLDSLYPESYSASLDGVKSYLREGAPAAAGKLYAVFEIQTLPQDLMFNLYEIACKLPAAQLDLKDTTGTSLREYLVQREFVLYPGSLKRAYEDNRIRLVGYETKLKRYWLKSLA